MHLLLAVHSDQKVVNGVRHFECTQNDASAEHQKFIERAHFGLFLGF